MVCCSKSKRKKAEPGEGGHNGYCERTVTTRNAGNVCICSRLRRFWRRARRVGAGAKGLDKRIDQFAPELEKIISTAEPITELASGFGGDLGPAEGPLWWKEGGYLLFSDIHNNRRMKYTPGQGVSVFQEPTNRANGLTRDLQGRLVACEHDTRRVTRLELDGSLTVIANSFQGRRLNRPNDVVVKSDGCIYFTDPGSFLVPEQWDLTFSGVYRITPDLGTMSLLVDDFIIPNGLAFSPDEKVLYINDTRRGHIRAFDMLPNGMLAKQTDRVFADLRGSEPGVPDGMKVDDGRQRLLRRRGRDLHHRSAGQEARPHRPRPAGDHQHRLRRRRLENALLHQPHHFERRQREDRRHSRAGAEEVAAGRDAARNVVWPHWRVDSVDVLAGLAVAACSDQRVLPSRLRSSIPTSSPPSTS